MLNNLYSFRKNGLYYTCIVYFSIHWKYQTTLEQRQTFNPTRVVVKDLGDHFLGTYNLNNTSIEVDLHFHEQGRVKLTVINNSEIIEDFELRMPTTNALTKDMQATALIMSAIERQL